MNSPRRRAREVTLKSLYLSEMVGCEADEALHQVLRDVFLSPVLEPVAREFIKDSSFNEILSGEVEEFIPDFSGTISNLAINQGNEIDLEIKALLEKYFDGLTYNPEAKESVAGLIKKVTGKIKKSQAVIEFAKQLVSCTIEHSKEIDEILRKTAQNWSLERMSCIDRSILRFATCELLFFQDIPVNATINEAIELAKQYSADKSFEFVNGILDRIRKENKLDKHASNSAKSRKSKIEKTTETA